VNAGDLLTLNIEKVAHGGLCVARHDGVVIFVRHALPGEIVEAKLISLAPGKRSWFAQTISVKKASEKRITPKCEFFKADGCGGCDWQHADSQYQRELKLEVLVEQLERFGQVANARQISSINAVEPSQSNWRTRIRVVANDEGKWGFRKTRSHEVQVVDKCLIADNSINDVLKTLPAGNPDDEILIVKSKEETIVYPVEKRAPSAPNSTQEVDGHDFAVAGDGFWQVHPGAASVLSRQIKESVQGLKVESFADLYAGVGVLAHSLLQEFPTANAIVVEADRSAAQNAKENLKGFKNVQVSSERVDKWVRGVKNKFDVVILDPPRSGAGQTVMQQICRQTLQKIIYIACDPAALARDILIAKKNGWELETVVAFDLFPQTHHIESVAVLVHE
jgi:tRNA/tmRNA/rRNA uracil-C5-methylase (TrmA/RlmC/RlmD family)